MSTPLPLPRPLTYLPVTFMRIYPSASALSVIAPSATPTSRPADTRAIPDPILARQENSRKPRLFTCYDSISNNNCFVL